MSDYTIQKNQFLSFDLKGCGTDLLISYKTPERLFFYAFRESVYEQSDDGIFLDSVEGSGVLPYIKEDGYDVLLITTQHDSEITIGVEIKELGLEDAKKE